jgi:hypothetical protein
LRIEPDGSSRLTIKRPRCEPRHIDVEPQDVAAVLADFQAIGEDPEKFKAFVNAGVAAV